MWRDRLPGWRPLPLRRHRPPRRPPQAAAPRPVSSSASSRARGPRGTGPFAAAPGSEAGTAQARRTQPRGRLEPGSVPSLCTSLLDTRCPRRPRRGPAGPLSAGRFRVWTGSPGGPARVSSPRGRSSERPRGQQLGSSLRTRLLARDGIPRPPCGRGDQACARTGRPTAAGDSQPPAFLCGPRLGDSAALTEPLVPTGGRASAPCRAAFINAAVEGAVPRLGPHRHPEAFLRKKKEECSIGFLGF